MYPDMGLWIIRQRVQQWKKVSGKRDRCGERGNAHGQKSDTHSRFCLSGWVSEGRKTIAEFLEFFCKNFLLDFGNLEFGIWKFGIWDLGFIAFGLEFRVPIFPIIIVVVLAKSGWLWMPIVHYL